MRVLLDANVLIAWAVEDHVHHDAAARYVATLGAFATTPITQGALLRLLLRNDVATGDALTVLTSIIAHDAHTMWVDDIPFDQAVLTGVIGHRQVTDAYLAALARQRSGSLATFDRGLAAAHPDVAVLVGSTE